MDTTEQYRLLVDVAQSHLKQTKAAYQNAMPGVTYEDMQHAAQRLLTFRRSYEKLTGRKVQSNPASKSQVIGLLR